MERITMKQNDSLGVRVQSVFKILGIGFFSVLIPIIELLFILVDYKGIVFDRVTKIWSTILCKIAGITITIEHPENLPSTRMACLVLSNHQSNFDIPIIMSSIPLNIRFVLKKSLFYIPFLGWCLVRHTIGIDRESSHSAMQKIRTRGKILAKQNAAITIFPEGTRSPTDSLQAFKRGSFLTAKFLQLPILPIVIYGSHYINPKNTKRIRGGKVKISILPMIPTDDPDYNNPRKLQAKIEPQMRERFLTMQQESAHQQG